MSKFTGGEWEFLEWPMSFADSTEHWYLVGSPERAVGFIRHEEDARLIVAAPEMCRLLKEVLMLKEELMPTSDCGGILSFSREMEIRAVLARIDGEEAKEING